MNGSRRSIAFAGAAALSASCVAPFSELQGARLAGPGAVEVTPFYSAVYTSDEGESAVGLYNQFGAHLAVGLSSKTDLRVRVERVAVDGEPDDAFTVIGAGPKFSLITDRIAVFLPVGFATGGGIQTSRTWQVHPTVLFTLPLSQGFEINPSAKLLVPLNNDDAEVVWAANLGAAFGPDVRRWAIRPEFGMLKNPGESGTAYQWSIGVSFGTRK